MRRVTLVGLLALPLACSEPALRGLAVHPPEPPGPPAPVVDVLPLPVPLFVAPSGSSSAAPQPAPVERRLSARDCEDLGAQFGVLARADRLSSISTKLDDDEREQAEATIERTVGPLENQWVDGCHRSLKGRRLEAPVLSCAMAARSVRVFEACLKALPARDEPR